MYFFYLDESGNTGRDLDSVDQPIHWIVGIACTPQMVYSVEADLVRIAATYCTARARRPDFELHGGDMFQGRGECFGMTPATRIAFYGDVLSTIGTHGLRIFIRGIDKAGHRDRAAARSYAPDHPHRLAMMYLIERMDEWLEGLNPGEEDPPLELGLLVADEQREVDREIVESFAAWRHYGTDHGYRTRNIRFLIDTVHYVPSQDSWLIQLADCVAYLRNRYSRIFRQSGWDRTKWSPSEVAVAGLWETHCAPHVESYQVWP